MVSKSECSVVYYSTALLTVLIFLTDAGAIATDYSKLSALPNSTTAGGGGGGSGDSSADILSHRTAKLAPNGRARSKLLKHQHHDRSPLNFAQLDATKFNNKSTPFALKYEQRELLRLSSSGGENDVTNKSGAPDDDDQKTLSQQVAEGKYALIHDEIFAARPRKLGVISYAANPEIPKDNVNNLGGLRVDDIWLAENHLLVLAGNTFDDDDGKNALQTRWQPIDDYVAPKRPVKLPLNPRIPPPFPVQLDDNAPVDYVKSSNAPPPPPFLPFNSFNTFRTANVNASSHSYAPAHLGVKPPNAFLPLRPPFKAPPLSTSFAKPPPGAEFLPPHLIGRAGVGANASDVDEDDPSLYYPPPYDFVYPKDNSSRVPAGPLVPGIVLPPPPDFFSALNDTSSARPSASTEAAKPTKQKSGKRLKIVANAPPPPPTSRPDTTTINYDLLNEVTDPHSDDKVKSYNVDVEITDARDKHTSQQWIPVPAPKPYYITGEKTPFKTAILLTNDDFSNTYVYSGYKKANSLKANVKKPPATKLYLQYEAWPPPQQQPLNATTTPSYGQIVSTKSSFVDEASETSPITPPASSSSSPLAQLPVKTTSYYFYEEPSRDDVATTTSTTTLPPPPPYIPSVAIRINDDALPAKQIVPNAKPTSTDEKKRRPAVTPFIPIHYLAELDNLVDHPLPIEPTQPPPPPPQLTPTTEYYIATTARPISSVHQQSTPTPIVEYNYVAANYRDHRPQISLPPPPPPPLPHSTPKPSQLFAYDDNAAVRYHRPPAPSSPPPPNPQLPPDIFASIAQFAKPHPHRAAAKPAISYSYFPNQFFVAQNQPPAYDSFADDPWLPTDFNFYHRFPAAADVAYTTENPYHAFFTREEADLIDDNTKEFFTLFGKKIRQRIESTTPLPIPATSTAGYISYSSTSPGYGDAAHQPPSLPLRDDVKISYVTPSPPPPHSVNTAAQHAAAFSSSFVRPIVVDDLPADLHARLNDIASLQNSPFDKFAALRQNYAPIYRRYDHQTRRTDAAAAAAAASTRARPHHDSAAHYPPRSDAQPTAESHSSRNDILVNYASRHQLADAAADSRAEYIGSAARTADRGGRNNGDYYFLTPVARSRINDRETNKRGHRRHFSSSDAEKSSGLFERIVRKSSSSANGQPKEQLR